MGLHTTEAIVLRRYPFRETSVIVSCLTDGFGKVKGLVKGLRGQPNRYRSAMEPLTTNRIVFYDTHSSQLHLISQCELLDALEPLQRDLAIMRLAASCIELADVVVPLEDPQPAIYELLKRTLTHLASGGAEQAMATRLHCILRLLRLAGFQPQVTSCTGCDSSLVRGMSDERRWSWSARQGGLLCRLCLHEDPRAESIGPEMVEALGTLSEADQPPVVEGALLPLLDQRLNAFLHWRLDRPLKTFNPSPSLSPFRGEGEGEGNTGVYTRSVRNS
jgi:DNA repair protein RecO (recombination protein O)